MKPWHKRCLIVLGGLTFLSILTGVALYFARDALVFFYTPSQIASTARTTGRTMRLGGKVVVGSLISLGEQHIQFDITDEVATVRIQFQGLTPALFREGQGVVAEGTWSSPELFQAKTLLTKHDENYRPPQRAAP